MRVDDDESPGTDEASERGADIRRRREAHGLSVREMSERSGVGRAAIAHAEAGRAAHLSYVRLENWLDAFDHELGMDQAATSADSGMVEFEVTGDFGVRFVARGPVADLEALERSVERFVKSIRESDADKKE